MNEKQFSSLTLFHSVLDQLLKQKETQIDLAAHFELEIIQKNTEDLLLEIERSQSEH